METELAIFKACADLTRLRILFLLAARELCVCELVEVLSAPQGRISRHLAVLKNAGLVDDRREGTWIYYSLRKAVDTPLLPLLHRYLAAADSPQAAEDRQRLEALAGSGRICAPRPTLVG